MRSLVVEIENYLLEMLTHSPHGWIEIQRKDIAERFACVPSQVTYVLNTRFDLCSGHFVESRRGGRGYIRIWRLSCLKDMPACDFTFQEDLCLLRSLYQQGLLAEREVTLLNLVFQAIEKHVSGQFGSFLKLHILKEVLEALGFLESRK